MTIERSIGPDYVTLSGLLGSPLQIAWLEGWVEQPEFPFDARWLIDNRGLETVATSEDARRLVDFFERFRDRIGAPRVALVVASDAAFGMGRVLEGWSAECTVEVRAFRDVDEARRWLLASGGDGDHAPRICA